MLFKIVNIHINPFKYRIVSNFQRGRDTYDVTIGKYFKILNDMRINYSIITKQTFLHKTTVRT